MYFSEYYVSKEELRIQHFQMVEPLRGPKKSPVNSGEFRGLVICAVSTCFLGDCIPSLPGRGGDKCCYFWAKVLCYISSPIGRQHSCGSAGKRCTEFRFLFYFSFYQVVLLGVLLFIRDQAANIGLCRWVLYISIRIPVFAFLFSWKFVREEEH